MFVMFHVDRNDKKKTQKYFGHFVFVQYQWNMSVVEVISISSACTVCVGNISRILFSGSLEQLMLCVCVVVV